MKKSRWMGIIGVSFLAGIILLAPTDVSAQWWKIVKPKDNNTAAKPEPTPTPTKRSQRRATKGISDSKISLGLKEALSKGVRFAVDSLGVEDGFYKNLDVKIPLPKSLKSVARVASFAGYRDRVDAFELAMNRAAEKAVPVAIDVFVDAIKQMSFSDAKDILFSGEDDAATKYFQKTSEEKLRGKF
ncbi:MAG: DUF4197 domain-containing protein, partial [Pyrinomonadaceae bacterium]|nr:DUF4197 domain-containing protein [Pyrinomonadaceae bacterium]